MPDAPAAAERPAGPSPWHRPLRWVRPALLAVVLAVLATLLLARLDYTAFWDDEACTAQNAQGILRTGDTTAWLDHGNLRAFRGGSDLHGFRDCVSPMLEAYVTAASFAVFGVHAWSGRLPFALLGLGTAALMLRWASRENPRTLAVLAAGLIGNVSLILFERNCRYYSLSLFFSVALGYLYWHGHGKPGWRRLAAFAGLSILLFASNYLNYLALYLCLGVDYLCWQRRKLALDWRAWAVVFVPQLVANGLIAAHWNPLLTSHADTVLANSLLDKCVLFCSFWRDLNQAEFLAVPVFLLALGIGLARRRTWLVRGCVAVALYLAALTVLGPQVVHDTPNADVRYAVPLIPLAIALETGALCILFGSRAFALGAAALLVFGTNLSNGGPLLAGGLRCNLARYVGELVHEYPDSYRLTSDWINAHVAEGQSVWVLPNYAIYPLMFHAPRALYAWQLAWPPRPEFADLPQIHFEGQVPPDYLIAFGPFVGGVREAVSRLNRSDIVYQRAATIDVYWEYTRRPELFWHTFSPFTGYDHKRQVIVIFKKETRSPAPPWR